MASLPSPPFTSDQQLQTPLTAEQRSRMIQWMVPAEAYSRAHGWTGDSLPANLSSLTDDQLIGYYKLIFTMATFHIEGMTWNPVTAVREGSIINPVTGQDFQNPLTTIEGFLTALVNPHLWIRVAEFGIGAIILAVGVNAVLRPGTSLSSSVSSVTKKAGKAALIA